MDLAKIRQKAKSGQGMTRALVISTPVPPVQEPSPDLVPGDADTAAQAVPTGCDATPAVQPEALFPSAAPVRVPAEPRKPAVFDPISVILAGRELSGCDTEDLAAGLETEQAGSADYDEMLCVRVCDETYGINIMRIKEIIKPREVTEIPRTPSFVSGVISLRGVIIPIIDVRDRLGLYRSDSTGKERVVVIRTDDDFSGLLVDEVTQVVRIPRDSLEAAPAVLDGINRDFVSAIGRADNRMIIVLNLESIADINLF